VTIAPEERRERRRRRRRREIVRWVVVGLLVLVVFGLGVALGQALHDNPKPGGTVSSDETFRLPSVPPGATITTP